MWTSKFGSCFDRDSFYLDLEKCRSVSVTVDAKCHAKAFAEAIAATAASTRCFGGKPKKTFACASGSAEGKAVACETAEAIVDLFISVGGHDNAVCQGRVAAAIDAIATAMASSASRSCSGSNQINFDSDFAFAQAIEEVFADVFISCFVYCEEGKNEAIAISDISGGADAGSKGSSTKIATGGDNSDASASTSTH